MYIIMDLSFEGQPSRQLATLQGQGGDEKQNLTNSTAKEGGSEARDRSTRILLLDNLLNKESDRFKTKIQREVKLREEQIAKLKEKSLALKRELERWQSQAVALEKENKRLKETVQTLAAGAEEKLAEVKQLSRQKEGQLQDKVEGLQCSVQKLKKCLVSLTKEYQVEIIKRQNHLEQLQRQYQQKIMEKDTQLAKTCQLLEKMRKDKEVSLLEKERDIQSLKQSVADECKAREALKSELTHSHSRIQVLQAKAVQLEQLMRSESAKFVSEMEQVKHSSKLEIQSWRSLLGQAQEQVNKLCSQFKLLPSSQTSLTGKILYLSSHFRAAKADEIVCAQQHEQHFKAQIERLRCAERQLLGKVAILQEQLDFTKKNLRGNDCIAGIIKQHLNQQEHLSPQHSICSKQYNQVKSTEKLGPPPSTNDYSPKKKEQEIPPKQGFDWKKSRKIKSEAKVELSECLTNESAQKHIFSGILSEKIEQRLIKGWSKTLVRPNDELSSQKEELASKKKSLIYLMRGEQTKTVSQLGKSSLQKSVQRKQRCGSMRELVSRRCEEQLRW